MEPPSLHIPSFDRDIRSGPRWRNTVAILTWADEIHLF